MLQCLLVSNIPARFTFLLPPLHQKAQQVHCSGRRCSSDGNRPTASSSGSRSGLSAATATTSSSGSRSGLAAAWVLMSGGSRAVWNPGRRWRGRRAALPWRHRTQSSTNQHPVMGLEPGCSILTNFVFYYFVVFFFWMGYSSSWVWILYCIAVILTFCSYGGIMWLNCMKQPKITNCWQPEGTSRVTDQHKQWKSMSEWW